MTDWDDASPVDGLTGAERARMVTPEHRPHKRWTIVGAVEHVDPDCDACRLREIDREALELAGQIARLDFILDWLDRARVRVAIRQRLRELAAEATEIAR